MQEQYLHYIWNQGLFDHTMLCDTNQVPINIVQRGEWNHNSGPDFFNAQIRHNGQLWAGNVEIHIRSSDWYRHGHQHDPAYNNTILHVVYKHDEPVIMPGGETLPCLELEPLIHDGMYQKYSQNLIQNGGVMCRNYPLTDFTAEFEEMKIKALTERLNRKCDEWEQYLKLEAGDWEKCFYISLCRYMGFKVNAVPMEGLARITPMKLLLKNRHNEWAIPALLFGQAGLLQHPWSDEYPMQLRNEYEFLKRKYSLEPMSAVAWKLHRMRPGNFPTLRIAQLASIIQNKPLLFTDVLASKTTAELKALFLVKGHDYWNHHYHFARTTKTHSGSLGAEAQLNLTVNVAVFWMYFSGRYHGNFALQKRALDLLRALPPENNQITRYWQQLGLENKSAFDSQALMGLKKLFCDRAACLRCEVGLRIISK